MFENIIKTCKEYEAADKHYSENCKNCETPSNEDISKIQYLNIDLAKSIIKDLDQNNAECIANIILAYGGQFSNYNTFCALHDILSRKREM